MVSAVEQFASSMSFSSFARAKELQARLWFTLGALVVYRLGSFLPLPGVDPAALQEMFAQNQGGVLGLFNVFAGGSLGRMSIFALNIMPYISASIIVQLMTSVLPSWAALKKEGEPGRRRLTHYTRLGTIALAALQAFGIAQGLQGITTTAGPLTPDPGAFFVISTVTSLVGGTVFLMWLGEQITARGVGNGISLIIFAGIVAELPRALFGTLELGRQGVLSTGLLLFVLLMAVAVITFVVWVERAQRRIVVQYPKRQRGDRVYGGSASHLPLKLNTSGVIPPIFASSLLLMPTTVAGFGATGGGQGWLQTVAALLAHGQPLYMFLYGALIVFFAFFYTSVVFNPVDTADNLKKNGGLVPGIRPGQKTAEYIDHVLTRLTTVGSIYLAVVCLIPEFLVSRYAIPFYFGGTSLLIMVSVTMDTVAQVHSHLISHQYEGLIRKARMKGMRL